MGPIRLVDWYRLSACLSTPYTTKRTRILFSEAISQHMLLHKYCRLSFFSIPYVVSFYSIPSPISLPFPSNTANSTHTHSQPYHSHQHSFSHCFSHSADQGYVRGPMSKGLSWGLALLWFLPAPWSIDEDNRAHNHRFLIYCSDSEHCKRQSLRIDTCDQNSKPFTSPSPTPSAYYRYFQSFP